MSGTTSDTQVYRIYINAPAEKVWEAITTSEWTNQYGYGGDVEIELRPGGAYRNIADEEMRQAGMPEVVVSGEVIEADPPRLLKLSWDAAWIDEPATTLTYEIAGFEGGPTCLTLTHEVADAPETAAQVAGGGNPEQGGGGWPWVLSGLKTVLETGSRMP